MKAMLLALAVVIVLIGVSAIVVYRDPNRTQTQSAFAVLHETSVGPPQDPATLGYLKLQGRQSTGLGGIEEFHRAFSAEAALKETSSWVVEGTILKQDYLLRQAEYKLAQLKRVGGDINSEELEGNRLAYVEATRKFQAFWDTKLPPD